MNKTVKFIDQNGRIVEIDFHIDQNRNLSYASNTKIQEIVPANNGQMFITELVRIYFGIKPLPDQFHVFVFGIIDGINKETEKQLAA
jgi:hypothetical protein